MELDGISRIHIRGVLWVTLTQWIGTHAILKYQMQTIVSVGAQMAIVDIDAELQQVLIQMQLGRKLFIKETNWC
jgi:hypothetical protein